MERKDCMKTVCIVAPEKYHKIAREAAHHISNVIGVTAAYWSIKRYKDQEFGVAGQQYVLFLGAKNENELVADFVDILPIKYKDAGIICCYDGPKAICYGEGEISQSEDFAIWMKDGISAALSVPPFIALPWAYINLASSIVGTKIKNVQKRKELQRAQTAASVMVFVEKFLRPWLGLPEERDDHE